MEKTLCSLLVFVFLGASAVEPWELSRAYQPLPRAHAKAKGPHLIPERLNELILKSSKAVHKPCLQFSLEDLHELLRTIYNQTNPVFEAIYNVAKDNRSLRHAELESLEREFETELELAQEDPRNLDVFKSGKCADILNLYVHHLSEKTRVQIARILTLPLMAKPPEDLGSCSGQVQDIYLRQLTCTSCHYGDSTDTAAQPPDQVYPVKHNPDRRNVSQNITCKIGEGTWDGNPHNWNRTRRCDEDCWDPICGVCDGVGGIANSDRADDFRPTPCEPIMSADEYRQLNGGSDPSPPLFPKVYTNNNTFFLLIGIKNDPFCFQVFPGPNSTFTNCYQPNQGIAYADTKNRRQIRNDYTRKGNLLSNITTHIYHGAPELNDMQIVLKKYAVGQDFCICVKVGGPTSQYVSEPIGVVKEDSLVDSKYLGRERIGVEYLWTTMVLDHWVKGPHHTWVDPYTKQIVRMWQPFNGLQVLDPSSWQDSVAADVWDEDMKDRAACKGRISVKCDSLL